MLAQWVSSGAGRSAGRSPRPLPASAVVRRRRLSLPLPPLPLPPPPLSVMQIALGYEVEGGGAVVMQVRMGEPDPRRALLRCLRDAPASARRFDCRGDAAAAAAATLRTRADRQACCGAEESHARDHCRAAAAATLHSQSRWQSMLSARLRPLRVYAASLATHTHCIQTCTLHTNIHKHTIHTHPCTRRRATCGATR
jgi:hypothetical protein